MVQAAAVELEAGARVEPPEARAASAVSPIHHHPVRLQARVLTGAGVRVVWTEQLAAVERVERRAAVAAGAEAPAAAAPEVRPEEAAGAVSAASRTRRRAHSFQPRAHRTARPATAAATRPTTTAAAQAEMRSNPSTTARPRTAPPAIDVASVPTRLLPQLVVGWKSLCEDERDSVIAATLVAADLARLGAPPAVLARAARVIEDEVRHVNVCSTVLDHLGATPDDVPSDRRRANLGADSSIERRAARALIAGFAVGEPMSAACFAASRAACREPLIRWGLTELLRDEARHGAFGIDAGDWLTRNWSPDDRRALWPICVAEMEEFERRLGGPIDSAAVPPPDEEAMRLGMLTAAQNCAAAVTAVERWVIPPLARLGIVNRAGD